jgi:hypothetical protein
MDSEGRLRTQLYDKRDDFNFSIVNFPFICSNIPTAPAYGVYISQHMCCQSKLEHVDDISVRELVGRIRVVVLQNKICPFLAQGICIYVVHSFL